MTYFESRFAGTGRLSLCSRVTLRWSSLLIKVSKGNEKGQMLIAIKKNKERTKKLYSSWNDIFFLLAAGVPASPKRVSHDSRTHRLPDAEVHRRGQISTARHRLLLRLPTWTVAERKAVALAGDALGLWGVLENLYSWELMIGNFWSSLCCRPNADVIQKDYPVRSD